MRAPNARPIRAVAAAVVLAVGLVPVHALAGQGEGPGGLTAPPAPATPRSVAFPKPVERTLANGLRVVVVEKNGMPLVSAVLAVRSGAETDPAGLAGLADVTATLLTKGTEKRSAPEIAEAMEALGGTLGASAGWDVARVSTTVTSPKIDAALEILADVVRNPTFKDEEIERYRAQAIDDLNVQLSQPGAIARYVAARVVFGDAPYGHPATGTPESLVKIARADVVKQHDTYYRPDNAVLVLGGDIKADAAFKLAERLFGDWAKPATSIPATPALAPDFAASAKTRVVVIDKPDAGQAAVVLVRPGIRRSDPEYYQGLVTNGVLGGGYSARLNQEIRIKRGLSYGASSRLDVRRDVGQFVASTQTKNESGAEVAGLLMSELKRLGGEAVPATELTPRQSTLTGNFARNLETTSGLVDQIATFAAYGLPLDTANVFIPSVQKVTAADVQTFASKRLASESASIVVVGNASQFLEALKKQFPSVDVIPVAELDLNSASLRKAK
jgi:zinc protease